MNVAVIAVIVQVVYNVPLVSIVNQGVLSVGIVSIALNARNVFTVNIVDFVWIAAIVEIAGVVMVVRVVLN